MKHGYLRQTTHYIGCVRLGQIRLRISYQLTLGVFGCWSMRSMVSRRRSRQTSGRGCLLMRQRWPDRLVAYLGTIGIYLGDLPQRIVSLQYAAIDAHKAVDIIDKEHALERVEHAALIWKGGGGEEADSSDLDEFL